MRELVVFLDANVLAQPVTSHAADRGQPDRLVGACRSRQILADAVEAEASFIITTDVDDYANEELASFDLSAVNPDYFMGPRFAAVRLPPVGGATGWSRIGLRSRWPIG